MNAAEVEYTFIIIFLPNMVFSNILMLIFPCANGANERLWVTLIIEFINKLLATAAL